jgi:hypothetical protein
MPIQNVNINIETIPTSYIIIGNVLNLVILLYQVVNQWYLDLI